MVSTVNHDSRPRPGGRTARITARVHSAVIELLTSRGHEACTFQNVAVRAGVERSTLYRRYPDRWTMIIDAYASRAEIEVAVEPIGDFARDFRLLVQRFAQFWSTKLAEAMLAMVLAVRGTPVQDRVGQFLDRRFAVFNPLFDAAIARGELPASVDRREMMERTAGAIIFRMLIANRLADEAWIDRLVADVLKTFGIGEGKPGQTPLRKETPS